MQIIYFFFHLHLTYLHDFLDVKLLSVLLIRINYQENTFYYLVFYLQNKGNIKSDL